MGKLIVDVHTSLDGYVAGPKGEFDNFLGGEDSLEFVCSLTDEADAALMGRRSFQMLDSYWPTAANKPGVTKLEIRYSNWYNRVPKYVLSKTLPPTTSDNTIILSDNIAAEINKIKQQTAKNILIFGSPTTVHSLLELNLIDGFWTIMHPVIFGEGIPLFNKIKKKVVKLELTDIKKLRNGIVCINHSVVR